MESLVCPHCAGSGYFKTEDVITIDQYTLHRDQNILRYGNSTHVIKLTNLEERMLAVLLLNRGRVVTRTHILNFVWNRDAVYECERMVDVYIGYLRKKIPTSLIKTVKGKGYIVQ